MKHVPSRRLRAVRLAAVPLAALPACQAQAFEVEDLRLRFDNTVRYSAAARIKSRSPALATTVPGATPGGVVGTNNVNQDDGDNN